MSLRVNLLKNSELRYQGPVSRRFLFTSMAGFLGMALLLAAGIGIYRYLDIRTSHSRNKATWARIAPAFERVTRAQDDLNSIALIQRELDGWGQGRIEWREFQLQLQRIVPPTIQLVRMESALDLKMVRPPPPATNDAPARTLKMLISGVSEGDFADDVVVQFVRLMQDSSMNKCIEKAKLQSIQTKKISRPDRPVKTVRLFEVEVKGGNRILP